MVRHLGRARVATEDILLKFEIEEGRTPNAEKVAEALLAWIDMLKAAAAAVAPDVSLEVGLVGVEDGSDIFKLVLRPTESALTRLKAGAAQYPLVTKMTIALAGLVATTVIATSITETMTPDPRIPEDQMEVFKENNRLIRESVELQREQQRFYSILQAEPAIKRMDVLRPDRTTIYSIPKSEFADRSGLWSGEETIEPTHEVETRTATWDVILIKPVLVAEQRRWIFARDSIEFSAKMEDEVFLSAIRDKTLKIGLAQGIRMRVEIKYREQRDGDLWVPVKGSHRVTRVLDPLPPAKSNPLFPGASAP
jgi:hypothetical protein